MTRPFCSRFLLLRCLGGPVVFLFCFVFSKLYFPWHFPFVIPQGSRNNHKTLPLIEIKPSATGVELKYKDSIKKKSALICMTIRTKFNTKSRLM